MRPRMKLKVPRQYALPVLLILSLAPIGNLEGLEALVHKLFVHR